MPAGTVKAEDLHLTLLYLGNPSEDDGVWDMDMIRGMLQAVVSAVGAD